MKTVVLCAVLLAGCASIPGVTMSDEERKACAAEGCSVWTDNELARLIRAAIERGIAMGKGRSA